LTSDNLINDLKNRKFHPVYLLHGPESYYIDQITNHFENHILDEGERSFNLMILYGKETDFMSVVDNARRFPMMSEYQIVILKEAQSMRDLNELEAYLKNPAPTTMLVICHKHGTVDGRTTFGKTIKEKAVVFESKKIYDNQMPAWISDHLSNKGFKIGPSEAALIADYLGADLSKVANEMEKLALNLLTGHKINKTDIEKYIGISKDFNVFELQDALGTRNKEKAYRIIQYFISNPRNNPLIVVVATLFSYFSKIYLMHFLGNSPDREVQKSLGLSNTYFIKNYRSAAKAFNRHQTERIIHLLRVYDLKSKGVGRDSFTEEAMMQELIYKILSA
jgi:DNA polymerase-3 subunit delta